MLRRLLGSVGLVLLVWLAGVAVAGRIESARLRIDRQSERITELGERCIGLRDEARRLGAPDRMLPASTATLNSKGQTR